MKGLLAALALLMAFIAAPAHAAPLKAVASFSVLGDMVARIGGERIALKVLVGPDGDAHGFEPSPADASALAAAGIVFVNGLGFEPWMEKLAAASGYRGPLIAASAGVIPREMQEDGHTHTDPHAWQDLANGAIYVRNIEAALASADPAGKSVYEANAAALLAELAGLDRWTRAEIGAVPAAKRKVITSHDAFGYFAAAYGVTFIAPEGLSTDAEPGAGDLARLIDQIRHEGIKALFIENMSDPRLIGMIARETGATPGGTLYSDALSPPDGPAPAYPAMFRNNVPKLKAAMLKN
jgi:zinc/manganese transport system substrate-binding protein